MTQSTHHTRFIVAFSLASGAAGLLPALDRLAVAWLRRQMVRILLKRHGVAFAADDVALLVGETPSSLMAFAAELGKGLFVSRLKGVLRPLRLMQRIGDVSQSFLLGTYLEHYLQHHHNHQAEQALSADTFRRLRGAVEQAAQSAIGTTAGGFLGNALHQAVEMAMATPKALWALTTAAFAKGEEAAEEVIETDASGFFARVAKGVEARFAEAGQAAARGYFAAFDAAWEQDTS